MKIILASLLFTTMLFSTHSKAAGVGPGIVFNPSFFYFMDKTKTSSTTTNTYQIINFKLGYLMPENIYLGFNYDMDEKEVKTTSTAHYNRKSMGASIGYISDGWQIIGTYFFSSKYDNNGTDYKGTGYAIDLGYVFNVGSIGLGPLLSYRSWSYNKLDSGAALNPKHEQTNIVPMIQIFASF